MDGEAAPPPPPEGDANAALRFEDLTIDDDLPLLDRVVRYCRSGIALQRLVHVKMLAETAETVGRHATIQTLVPLLNLLISDPESIIRQHLATQLLPLSIVCMVEGVGPLQDSSQLYLDNPSLPKHYHKQGYKIVTSTIITHLNTLIMDVDIDVRRAASEALVGLSLQLERDDIAIICLPIPLRLAHSKTSKNKGDSEELRVTAANLLAELSGSSELGHVAPSLVQEHIMPCVLALCLDSSFRVRRGAAQALPRVLGGCLFEDAQTKILPAFEKLSRDDMYRVRKSTGECLVDMSRSMMILASHDKTRKENIKALRRNLLIPIANRLLDDTNKFVRHGMMQFLGPFIASFYPLQEGNRALHATLPGGTDTTVEAPPPVEGSSCGIGAQFFPHASSMVSRLNSSMSSAGSSPTPTPASFTAPSPVLSDMEQLQQRLPPFMRANRMSILTLRTVVAHRESNPPDAEDIKVVKSRLLKHFVGLARIGTGDENTDAEMKVYCAYSFPAVLLLLGSENWDGMVKECFLTLINPNHGIADVNPENVAVPPLPVKRCLSSSLHTVAHILGPRLTQEDIMVTFQEYFFRDTDDSVRLNVIRNFPWLMSLLPHSLKCEYVAMWFEVVKGEDLLGAHKRSVTNPMLLNWRQRDYVSRSMPDMLSLVDPTNVRKYLWPILQQLLTDSISQVREDAEWSIPLLLRVYCADNMDNGRSGEVSMNNMQWSADACQEVIAWLKQTILGVSANGNSTTGNGHAANFCKRQLYCRICAAVGLAVRFSDVMEEAKDEVLSLDRTFEDMLRLHGSTREEMGGKGPYSPYQSLTPAERKHLRRFLVYDLLPLALEMKEDRVTNVRLTLMKTLQSLPADVKGLAAVSAVLQDLEDEVETWESVYASEEPSPAGNGSVIARTMVSSVSPSKTPPPPPERKQSIKGVIPNAESKSPPRKSSTDDRSHASSTKSKKKKRKDSVDDLHDGADETHSPQAV